MFSPNIGRHNVLLRCLPAREAFQRVVNERFEIFPCQWSDESVDGFGNRIITAGTGEEHNQLTYCAKGELECSTYCIDDPHPHPMYRLPSLLTVPTPHIMALMPPLTGVMLKDIRAIMHIVHQHITYTPGTTTTLTTAADVCLQRRGVCQDFAHLMVVLCRKAGYAARYVCGLMDGEGQTHAWVEVHDGQCWYAFDPTNDTSIATGFVKLAHGRDARDCTVIRGVYRPLSNYFLPGGVVETTDVVVKVATL